MTISNDLLDALMKDYKNPEDLIGKSWRRNWERVTPLFSYPPDIHKAIYTTNAIESVSMSMRKVTKKEFLPQ